MKIYKQTILIAAITLILNIMSVSAQSLVPTVEYPDQANPKGSKISLVKQLPSDTNWTIIFADIVKIILGITGSLALAAFTVGGVMLVTAQGQEEKISKGKGILYWSILALVIIAVSYAVVVGISQLQFFQ